MPRGNGTGPAGMGPMTGRAAGYCAGYPAPGYLNPYGGRMGFGFGRGAGRMAMGVPAAGAGWYGAGAFPVRRIGWGAYPAFGPQWPGARWPGFGRGRGRGRW